MPYSGVYTVIFCNNARQPTVMSSHAAAKSRVYHGLATSHHQPREEGIAEVQSGMAFTLTPNPAHGHVTLTVHGGEAGLAEGMQMTLHDAAGREVMRRTLHSRETWLSLAGLPAGLYTVSVEPARRQAAGGNNRVSAEAHRLRLIVE